MVDIRSQVAYWREGAAEDWEVARSLLGQGKVRHGLFFAHLALEKALKARVCERTGDLAPRTHNLVRLAEAAGLELASDHIDSLAEMNAFALEGRYPDALAQPPTQAEARAYMARAEKVWRCLTKV